MQQDKKPQTAYHESSSTALVFPCWHIMIAETAGSPWIDRYIMTTVSRPCQQNRIRSARFRSLGRRKKSRGKRQIMNHCSLADEHIMISETAGSPWIDRHIMIAAPTRKGIITGTQYHSGTGRHAQQRANHVSFSEGKIAWTTTSEAP